MPTDTTFNAQVPLCRRCEHGLFDETFGEYKCKKLEIPIYDAYYRTECKHYDKKDKDELTFAKAGV